MKKFIFNLRQQPVAVRKHILHVTTFVIAALLLVVWVYSLAAVSETPNETSQAVNPVSVLGAGISNGYASLGEQE